MSRNGGYIASLLSKIYVKIIKLSFLHFFFEYYIKCSHEVDSSLKEESHCEIYFIINVHVSQLHIYK